MYDLRIKFHVSKCMFLKNVFLLLLNEMKGQILTKWLKMSINVGQMLQ